MRRDELFGAPATAVVDGDAEGLAGRGLREPVRAPGERRGSRAISEKLREAARLI